MRDNVYKLYCINLFKMKINKGLEFVLKVPVGVVVSPLGAYWIGKYLDEQKSTKLVELNKANFEHFVKSSFPDLNERELENKIEERLEEERKSNYKNEYTSRFTLAKFVSLATFLASLSLGFNYNNRDDYKVYNEIEAGSQVEVSQVKEIKGKRNDYWDGYFPNRKMGEVFSVVSSVLTPIPFGRILGEDGQILTNTLNINFDGFEFKRKDLLEFAGNEYQLNDENSSKIKCKANFYIKDLSLDFQFFEDVLFYTENKLPQINYYGLNFPATFDIEAQKDCMERFNVIRDSYLKK